MLVVSREEINQVLPVINVIPLTSKKSDSTIIYPNEVVLPANIVGLKVDSIALCYQIRTLDKSRLEKDFGELCDVELRKKILPFNSNWECSIMSKIIKLPINKFFKVKDLFLFKIYSISI